MLEYDFYTKYMTPSFSDIFLDTLVTSNVKHKTNLKPRIQKKNHNWLGSAFARFGSIRLGSIPFSLLRLFSARLIWLNLPSEIEVSFIVVYAFDSFSIHFK